MDTSQEAHRLAAIQNQITAINPTRQMFRQKRLLEHFAGVIPGHIGEIGSDQPPAVAGRIVTDSFKHYDIAQYVLQITRRDGGSLGHRAIASLGPPHFQKMIVKMVAKRQSGVTIVKPLFPGRPLVEGFDCGNDVHCSILGQKP